MQANVLVIDDEADVRKLVATALSLDGHDVYEAVDGRQGVDMAFEILPDLIILDVMMPRMDGFEALSLLRNHRKTRKTPIILLTARTAEHDRIAGLSGGADDYIPKPFSLEELRLRVDKHLSALAERRRLSRIASQDPVTELGNRRAFGEAFDRWWERSTKAGGSVSTVCLYVEGLEQNLTSQAVFSADALMRRVGTAIRSELEEGEEPFDLGSHRFIVLTYRTGRDLVCVELRLAHAIERVLRSSAAGFAASVRSTSATPHPGESQESFLARALSRQPDQHGTHEYRAGQAFPLKPAHPTASAGYWIQSPDSHGQRPPSRPVPRW